MTGAVDCTGRAGINTEGALAAIIVFGFVGLQFPIREDRAVPDPGTKLRVNQQA